MCVYRYLTERKLSHESWFLYYPEEENKRGAPTQLLRGVEFGLETKALLYKRLCAYAGLHCEVNKQTNYNYCSDLQVLFGVCSDLQVNFAQLSR